MSYFEEAEMAPRHEKVAIINDDEAAMEGERNVENEHFLGGLVQGRECFGPKMCSLQSQG